MGKPRTLLALTDPAILDTFLRLLAPAFEIVGMHDDVTVLPHVARRERPDVVVLGLPALPQAGLHAVSALRDMSGALCIIVVAADATFAARAFQCGASAYILETASEADLLAGIRAAVSGRP